MREPDHIPPSSIRIPTDLKEAVMRRAVAEGRTFSQHVVYLLRQYVHDTPEPETKPARKSRKA